MNTTMKNEYEYLKPYVRPSSYMGATWYGYADVAGTNRDADVLGRSNFECWVAFLTKLLGAPDEVISTEARVNDPALFTDAERDDDEDAYNWTICEESHWACGWIKIIRVHMSLPHEKLAAIDAQLAELDGYPVFNEDHYSRLESDERKSSWDMDCKRIWHTWLEKTIGGDAYELLMSVYAEEIECVLQCAFDHDCMNSGSYWAEPSDKYTIDELRADAECDHYGDKYVRLFENLFAAEAAWGEPDSE